MLITGLFRWLKTAGRFVRAFFASRLILIRLEGRFDDPEAPSPPDAPFELSFFSRFIRFAGPAFYGLLRLNRLTRPSSVPSRGRSKQVDHLH
jgi:hypothetical protein